MGSELRDGGEELVSPVVEFLKKLNEASKENELHHREVELSSFSELRSSLN